MSPPDLVLLSVPVRYPAFGCFNGTGLLKLKPRLYIPGNCTSLAFPSRTANIPDPASCRKNLTFRCSCFCKFILTGVLCIRCTQNLECEGAALQVFGKFNIAETLRQQGINPCTIAEGKNADAQFPFSDWTPAQERLVNSLVDHIYAGFIRKVKALLSLLSSLLLHAFPAKRQCASADKLQ